MPHQDVAHLGARRADHMPVWMTISEGLQLRELEIQRTARADRPRVGSVGSVALALLSVSRLQEPGIMNPWSHSAATEAGHGN